MPQADLLPGTLDLLILKAVSLGPEHGYGVLLRIEQITGGALLVDQGTSDQFLQSQLKPELLEEACRRARVGLELRLQEGYDHSYFFIASFIEDHLRFHSRNL